MSKTVEGPDKWNPAPEGYKGGPGKYDGKNDSGFPPRTGSPNAVPEKFYDQTPPLPTGKD